MGNTPKADLGLPSLIIITGLSGSGMSSATNAFEDLGYFCVDNLPLTMLSTFGRLLVPTDGRPAAIEKAVLVINIRERHFLSEFSVELKKLARKKLVPFVVFFEASDEVLQRRFSETRRPHPADNGKGLIAAIRTERRAMTDVRRLADLIIDTTDHTVHTLRHLLVQKFSPHTDGKTLNVEILSFGHKYGNPRTLDLLFDVRHLPNPYFQKDLKELPGDTPQVLAFFAKHPEADETVQRLTDLLTYLLPKYKREGKSYLTIGVGCTGGRHRSVMVANAIGKALKKIGDFEVAVSHRDIQK
ncbi:MAG TPA: RNase adapter RapZ [Pyrinomonadaceae bacterium]|nr:RNase adapter RapZ [Chloracidobacterium sp.]MBP9935947.1 RNase adapter RapZ [Pyrinomonadaceae bacterium]MBK7803839.1 RNase adapter RapZ [Chloracidobacterium sp.]MBL0239223.1 RNase adapter RapZ [Chloracidobacterium sp.]HQX55120.1 RNase adapter RapZ [Pyrinomonadaceae bacterium]